MSAAPWDELVTGPSVTCYLSMADEPPTGPLIHALEKRGIRVAVPIMRPGRQLVWGWHGQPLAVNGYGVAEPPEDTTVALDSMSAMIIPALRAGRDGSRMGRGAGYYDRALAQVRRHDHGGPLRIVIVYDDEVDDAVPCQPHDAPIDVIVTPTTVYRVTAQP